MNASILYLFPHSAMCAPNFERNVVIWLRRSMIFNTHNIITEFKLCSEVLLKIIVTFMKQFLCRLNTIAGGKQQSDVKGMSYKSDSFVIFYVT